MTDLVDYLREKLEDAKAEDLEVHVRVNGWCHRCGGTGRPDVAHEDLRGDVLVDLGPGRSWRYNPGLLL